MSRVEQLPPIIRLLARALEWTPAKLPSKRRFANVANLFLRQGRAGNREAGVHQIPYVTLVIEPEQVPELVRERRVVGVVSDRADAELLFGGAPPLSPQTDEPAAG